ncbi:C45 family autoproteolytic acyltransferase/hydrolase [Mesosutterella sp. OilRF-GAM-744-9]|uniref:C45 family autoproteolytic acyltransferase/hydrolase n=1 Tax=Mesosutterella porci TaxID=2915351 RepID=A0ABS9MMV6_9BURK|nr:C45 family autoproteolytic acyltransferase/hydolase [Mesosutterella sp. oilRF-744-WT-GAM-9]MCG5029953.1 C45 family autoproteolytic acyltransferase/hydrolase [Mesosutterella sp. oilRF-744-WT-GAM-9]
MKGIAEGVGVDFASILTLYCSSEEMSATASVPEDSCSAIAVPPEASGNGRTYLGQNWDWWSIGRGTTVLLEVEQKPFARCLIVTEAGLVGGKGLNEFGLGPTMNALSVKKGRGGVPVQVLLRAALSQRTVRRRSRRSRARSAPARPASDSLRATGTR